MSSQMSNEFTKLIFDYVKAGKSETITILNELEIVKQIAILKERDYYGWCILHWAIYNNRDQLAKDLIDKYILPTMNTGIELRTGTGFFHGDETPLHIALRYSYWRSPEDCEDLVLYLLDKGADPRITDQNGMTALHWAASQNRLRVINTLLLHFRDDLILKKDKNEQTALHIAVIKKHRNSIEALASYRNGILLDLQDKNGKSPAELMRECDDQDIISLYERILQNRLSSQQNRTVENQNHSQSIIRAPRQSLQNAANAALPPQSTNAVESAVQNTAPLNDNHKDSSLVMFKQSIKPALRCPINRKKMKDPVSVVDGHTFERSAISNWFKTHNTCPYDGKALPSKKLVPNYQLKAAIEAFDTYKLTFFKNNKKRDGDEIPKATNGHLHDKSKRPRREIK
jgi:ankyrin repeat protein